MWRRGKDAPSGHSAVRREELRLPLEVLLPPTDLPPLVAFWCCWPMQKAVLLIIYFPKVFILVETNKHLLAPRFSCCQWKTFFFSNLRFCCKKERGVGVHFVELSLLTDSLCRAVLFLTNSNSLCEAQHIKTASLEELECGHYNGAFS